MYKGMVGFLPSTFFVCAVVTGEVAQAACTGRRLGGRLCTCIMHVASLTASEPLYQVNLRPKSHSHVASKEQVQRGP